MFYYNNIMLFPELIKKEDGIKRYEEIEKRWYRK